MHRITLLPGAEVPLATPACRSATALPAALVGRSRRQGPGRRGAGRERTLAGLAQRAPGTGRVEEPPDLSAPPPPPTGYLHAQELARTSSARRCDMASANANHQGRCRRRSRRYRRPEARESRTVRGNRRGSTGCEDGRPARVADHEAIGLPRCCGGSHRSRHHRRRGPRLLLPGRRRPVQPPRTRWLRTAHPRRSPN